MTEVRLKGKNLRTPQGKPLDVPTQALAKAIEEEWRADAALHYQKKPLTALVATALDQIAGRKEKHIGSCLQEVPQDTLLFWEKSPDSLLLLQKEKWQPCLDQVNTLLELQLKPTFSLSLSSLSAEEEISIIEFLTQQENFTLAGFFNLLAITRSFSLSFLLVKGLISPDKAWEFAHLHEHFQCKTWGKDENVLKREEDQHQDFLATIKYLDLLGTF